MMNIPALWKRAKASMAARTPAKWPETLRTLQQEARAVGVEPPPSCNSSEDPRMKTWLRRVHATQRDEMNQQFADGEKKIAALKKEVADCKGTLRATLTRIGLNADEFMLRNGDVRAESMDALLCTLRAEREKAINARAADIAQSFGLYRPKWSPDQA